MSINSNDSMYEMYLEEIKDQIENLEESMVTLESENDNDELINEIFRIVHTMKGSSSTFKVEIMTHLLHNFESLLSKLKSKEIQIDLEIMELNFEVVDSVRYLYICMTSNEQYDENEINNIIKKIQKILKLSEEKYEMPKEIDDESVYLSSLNGEEKDLCKKVNSDLKIYKIEISLNESVDNKKIILRLLVDGFSEEDVVLSVSLKNYEELEEKDIQKDFYIIIASKKKKASIYKEIEYLKEDIKTLKILEVVEEQPEEQHKTKMVDLKEKTNIKVDVNKVDKLLNLVGELIIDKEILNQLGTEARIKFKGSPIINQMLKTFTHINFISYELQEMVMSIRMLPLENLFNRYPRMVRDLAIQCNKQIDFIIEGKETEIDRNIMEQLSDPLMHIIRNAIDHGIEPKEEREKSGKKHNGTLKLTAAYSESSVIIEVEDDGNGIDIEKVKEKAITKNLIKEEEIKLMTQEDILQFIFMPGFSTADKVSEISGRGVGMDVVKSSIRKLNGSIDIETLKGKGTKFIIRLPLTIEIIQALMIKEAEHKFAIPIFSIIEIIRLKGTEICEKIHSSNDIELFEWREEFLPLIEISNYFNINNGQENLNSRKKVIIVIVGYGEKKLALQVDKLVGSQEIVIKPMGSFIGKDKLLGEVGGICGESILGDGTFAHILDIGILSEKWKELVIESKRKKLKIGGI